MQYAVVEYYNVKFYIIFKRDEDISKFWYLSNRIEAGEKLYISYAQALFCKRASEEWMEFGIDQSGAGA